MWKYSSKLVLAWDALVLTRISAREKLEPMGSVTETVYFHGWNFCWPGNSYESLWRATVVCSGRRKISTPTWYILKVMEVFQFSRLYYSNRFFTKWGLFSKNQKNLQKYKLKVFCFLFSEFCNVSSYFLFLVSKPLFCFSLETTGTILFYIIIW